MDEFSVQTYRLSLFDIHTKRIAELELAIELAAHALESSYGDLPKDKHPGPPTAIINNLRHALTKRSAS